MGPRSIDRGNQVLRSEGYAMIALQWGRDQLIAEIKKRLVEQLPVPKSFNGAAIN